VVVVVDNYDSFTFNLVQYLAELGAEVRVFRNDAIDRAGIEALAPRGVLVGPGPGRPEESAVSLDVIRDGSIPVLGVCLGHQAIGELFGGRVVRAERLMHGRTSPVEHDGRGVFEGLPSPFVATRYHSLVVDPATVGPDFEVSARTERGEVMGLRWKGPAGSAPMEGVQFHPESVLTPLGFRILAAFARQAGHAVDDALVDRLVAEATAVSGG